MASWIAPFNLLKWELANGSSIPTDGTVVLRTKEVYATKKFVSVLLIGCISLSGCTLRQANPIQVHHFDDEQKSCKVLHSELFGLQENIASLGIEGILLALHLLFIDPEQGEKKEMEAYNQRYDYLLMLAQEKDCKLSDNRRGCGCKEFVEVYSEPI